jgi:hypothetical protein
MLEEGVGDGIAVGESFGEWLFWSGSWKFGSKRQWQAPVDRTDFAKGGSMQ